MADENTRRDLLPVFFGILACSWMPHWSCHYYKIETDSTFIVGSLIFDTGLSLLAMLLYSILVIVNLIAISDRRFRFAAACASGVGHITLGAVHIFRLMNPFHFEVFGYEWSMASSLREVLLISPLGILCLGVALQRSRGIGTKTE